METCGLFAGEWWGHRWWVGVCQMLDTGETLGLLRRNSSWGWTASDQAFVGCGSVRDPEHRPLPHCSSDDVLTKISVQ